MRPAQMIWALPSRCPIENSLLEISPQIEVVKRADNSWHSGDTQTNLCFQINLMNSESGIGDYIRKPLAEGLPFLSPRIGQCIGPGSLRGFAEGRARRRLAARGLSVLRSARRQELHRGKDSEPNRRNYFVRFARRSAPGRQLPAPQSDWEADCTVRRRLPRLTTEHRA